MSKKRAAVELSISTIVVVVIGISMLILGLVLVNKVMCGAINGINIIDKKMQDEMTRMFGNEFNIVIKEQENNVYKNVKNGHGVAYAVRNDGMTNPEFTYEVTVSDLGDCKFSESRGEDFIILGQQGKMTIKSGSEYFDLIKFKIPDDVEPCQLKYDLIVKNDGVVYEAARINILINEKPFSKALCGS